MAETEAVTGNRRKRRRDPERTREAILEVAGKVLATDGAEGLSVSKVAQIVGVNRGTAYHHFQTREQLLTATVNWVSEKLCREAFGDIKVGDRDDPRLAMRPRQVTENLVNFAMEYPEYGRVWLAKMLNSSQADKDPYWERYRALMDNFAQSELAEPGIDIEVHAMLMVVGAVLWPVWTRAGKRSELERRKLAERFTDEVLRLNMHGVLKSGSFPELEQQTASRGDRSEQISTGDNQ